ncbi:peptidase M23 [Tenacibaculum sp. Bg11-29]|uniref:aminotransferase class III-fold pyridoxal phosphate-dependent enzyme n=1 Tax=Tenacibaculum sp. Bg11-29 TaxID=2058306 RepID=UPI000C323B0E|nr:aminotransferase class III-fold pyridoxal phosphate-dependent enzyme [Tenacibaculum sp. Bg11-29]PKH51315.1 peptidase M23 [Tenacibaculum sp. Bg11-29]
MNYDKIKITSQQAENILLQEFNINGKAKELPGEVDFNFRIKVEGEDLFILKISRPNENESYLDFQQKILQQVEKKGKDLLAPKVIKNKNGKTISNITDDFGNERKVRLLSWISGRVWSSVNPQLNELRYSLGEQCGKLTKALEGFEHLKGNRKFEWDVAQALWTTEYIHLFDKEEKTILQYFQDKFKKESSSYETLRKAVVHNDANDNNIIVSNSLVSPKVKAAIDYGDAIYTQIINDVAITCAYAIMHHNNPLQAALPIIKGYHASFSLNEEELKHLYTVIAMRLVISVTKSAINKQKEPDNTYLLISEKPAWEVLKKWMQVSSEFAEYSFRKACDYSAHPKEEEFKEWVSEQNVSFSALFPSIKKETIYPLDLSVASLWLGNTSEFNDLELFQFKLNQLQKEYTTKIIAGGYLEARSLYTSSDYDRVGNNGKESRTTHLGIDFWLPAETPIHSPFNATITTVTNNDKFKEYGGLIILKHKINTLEFYTLYGHLSKESLENKKVGDAIFKGDCIGYLGNSNENGSWASHLHFQVMLSMLNLENDFPGVAYYSEIDVWKSICPNPNLFFKSKILNQQTKQTNEELIAYRKEHLGKSLSLQYKVPVKMVRGNGVYLIDQYGNKYIDTVNNVAHVGHEHPAVVKAGQQQMAVLNTNSRYLHENINELAKELIATFPPELNVIHFVNSGSEANELAIRMIKANTGQCDIIASEVGYHGNSNMCIDISSYKFDGKGGKATPEHTHIIPLPDTFRGKYTDDDAVTKYAKEVLKQIVSIKEKGRNVGAFIIEPIISCGGQVELPKGFLAKVYEYIRNEGGLCISDEVQTGCGRMGETFWGFELHNVVPDIVTIGKPLGNGHPLAAVVCTQEVANKFSNGMEYFNTFGGNPVSCAIGTAVIQTVKREKLQENALVVGKYLKSELKKLANNYPIIGDVRGKGLFLGFELVDVDKKPLPEHASYLANRMKVHRILMSTDGPDNNVLKIKPPIIFSKENANELLFYLKKIIKEDFMMQFNS